MATDASAERSANTVSPARADAHFRVGWATLVKPHLGWVYAVARRRLGNAALAEDVAQEVCIAFWRQRPGRTGDERVNEERRPYARKTAIGERKICPTPHSWRRWMKGCWSFLQPTAASLWRGSIKDKACGRWPRYSESPKRRPKAVLAGLLPACVQLCFAAIPRRAHHCRRHC